MVSSDEESNVEFNVNSPSTSCADTGTETAMTSSHALQTSIPLQGAFVFDDNTNEPHTSSPVANFEFTVSSDDFEDQSSNGTSDTSDEVDDDDENGHLYLTLDDHGMRAVEQGVLQNIQLQKVDRVPYDINGTCGYSLTAHTRAELLQTCKDGRPWKKDSGTHWKGYNTTRYKNCNGSLKCPNFDWQYFIHTKKENRLKFDKNKMCSICGADGSLIPCPARK